MRPGPHAGAVRIPVAPITPRRNTVLCTCSRIIPACCSGLMPPPTIPPSGPDSSWGCSSMSVTRLT